MFLHSVIFFKYMEREKHVMCSSSTKNRHCDCGCSNCGFDNSVCTTKPLNHRLFLIQQLEDYANGSQKQSTNTPK